MWMSQALLNAECPSAVVCERSAAPTYAASVARIDWRRPSTAARALQELRQLIEASVPEVQERISYGTTVILALQRDLVGLGAQKKHLSFFIMSPELAAAMREQIERTHRLSGATIHFNPDTPLPASLVKELLRARLEEEANDGA